MEKHFEFADVAFEKQFQSCTMNPTIFSHEAHLRLAWIHIRKHGIEKAITNICDQIQAFANANGEHNKYNVTVTIAAVRAVHHFELRSKSDTFYDFIAEFPGLKNEFTELLDSHYSLNIFKSTLAKGEYVAPDLQPFD